MWSIGEVKREGWQKVKNYYWPALLVTIIAGFLSGGSWSGGGSGLSLNFQNNHYYESSDSISDGVAGVLSERSGAVSNSFLTEAGLIFASVAMGVLLLIVILAFVFKIFVGNVIVVGNNRYFMESRGLGESSGIGKIFWGFSCGICIHSSGHCS